MTEYITQLEQKTNEHLSNDASKKKTRECICTALVLLLKDTPYEKISVSAIIEKSGVSRAGFYRNFKSKEDVINAIAISIASQIESYRSNSTQHIRPEDWMYAMIQEIDKNSTLLVLLLNSNINPKTLFPLNQIESLLQLPDSPKERYIELGIISAVAQVISIWLLEGKKESPKEMTTICMDLIAGFLKVRS